METLAFGSFPRSGGHFFKHLTNCKWFAHVIHDLEKESNVVVSVRNPVDCIPSWITLTGDLRPDRAEKVLEWYCAYYEKVKELDIVIIPFDQLIADPLFCINHACKRYGLEQLRSINYDLSDGFHDPTSDKSQYDKIKDEMINSPSFQPAMRLFEALCVPVG